MARARFFVEGVFESGQTLTLAGEDAHKVVDVLRKRTGDNIEIIDSTAQQFVGTLQIDGRAVQARLGDRQAPPQEQLLEITVAQGIPKGSKMDFVVEKLTELGVAAIVPLRSERTFPAAKVDRWQRLAKAAAAQCGRASIPEVQQPQAFGELLATFPFYDAVLFPWELSEHKPMRDALPETIRNARRVLIVIGPEGGFSHAEAEAAQRTGAKIISLGSRILRTETAALVLVALLNYLAGE